MKKSYRLKTIEIIFLQEIFRKFQHKAYKENNTSNVYDRNNQQFVSALDKKIKRLQINPNLGGYLSGSLHGYKSIRKYRVLYRINEPEGIVYLVAIDHRKHNYERF